MRGLAWRGALFAVGVAIVAALPLYISLFRATQFAYVGVFFIALIGLNILTGYTGQISLGHGAFMAIGAYATAILSVNHGVDMLITIPIGGICAGIAGFLFGFPALRLAGVYLALATFALAVIVPSIAKRFEGFTGGTNGILLDLPTSPTGRLAPEDWLYYLTWAIGIVLLLAALVLLRGKTGRAFRAIRDNELAAVASGVSLSRYKTIAFGISAFYAGIAGSLYAIQNFIVNPGTFPIELSILLLVGLVVGGAGSMVGIVLGAAFVEFIPLYSVDILRVAIDAVQAVGLPVDDVDPTTTGVASVVYGVVLLLVLVLMPRGAAGLIRGVVVSTKQAYRRQTITAEPVTPPRSEA